MLVKTIPTKPVSLSNSQTLCWDWVWETWVKNSGTSTSSNWTRKSNVCSFCAQQASSQMSQPMGLPKLKRAMMKSSHMTKELIAMWSLTIETSLPLTRNARATSSALCLGLSALIQLKSSVLHKANSLRKKSSEVMPSSYSTSVMFQLSNWAALERSSATSWLILSWFAMPSLSFGSLFTHSFWTAGSTPRNKQVKRWM